MKKSFLQKVIRNVNLIDSDFSNHIRGRYIFRSKWKVNFPSLHYFENRSGWYVVEKARTLETRVMDTQPSKVYASFHFSLFPQHLDRRRSPQKNITIQRRSGMGSLDHKIGSHVWPGLNIGHKEDRQKEFIDSYFHVPLQTLEPINNRAYNSIFSGSKNPVYTNNLSKYIDATDLMHDPMEHKSEKPMGYKNSYIDAPAMELATFQQDIQQVLTQIKKNTKEEPNPTPVSQSATSMPFQNINSLVDINRLTDEVYQGLERKIRIERERRGL